MTERLRPDLSLGPIEHLKHWAVAKPNDLAMVGPSLKLTFSELWVQVTSVAANLANAGVTRGDKVIVDFEGEYERIYSLACMMVGAVSAGPPDRADYSWLKQMGFSHALVPATSEKYGELNQIEISQRTLDSWIAIPVEQIVSFEDFEIVRVVFSSGTTGQSKGICFSFGALMARNASADEQYMSASPFYCLLSFRTISGNTSFFLELWRGQVGYVPGTAEWNWKQIVAKRIAGIMASPFHLQHLVDVANESTEKADSLRIVHSAGSFLPNQLGLQATKVFDAEVIDIYGSTEVGLVAKMTITDEGSDYLGTLYPGVDVQVLREDGTQCDEGEIGELSVSTPYIANGYLAAGGAAEAFAEDRFVSGDLGFLDGNQMLRLAGRKDELINLGGFKIDPLPIEQRVKSEPEVSDALCVVATDQNGKQYHVMLVVVEGSVDVNSLQANLKAKFGVSSPQRIVPVATLPRNLMGKLVRRANISL